MWIGEEDKVMKFFKKLFLVGVVIVMVVFGVVFV